MISQKKNRISPADPQNIGDTAKSLLRCWPALLFLTIFVVFCNRNVIFSSGLMGDCDGTFCNLVTEHWFRVFTGKDTLGDLRIFAPYTDALAYSDSFLGYHILYTPLRLAGLNLWNAFKYTIIAFQLFGVICMFYICKVKLGFKTAASVIGGIMLAGSNLNFLAAHPQYYAVYMIPLTIILLMGFIRNIDGFSVKRRIYGVAAIAWTELILYTSFNVGFYVALFVILFAAAALVVSWRQKMYIFRRALAYIRTAYAEIFVYAAVAVLLIIPFLRIYLPTFQRTSGRNWGDVVYWMPLPEGIIALKHTSLLYGKLLESITDVGPNKLGFPLVTLFLFICALITFGLHLTRGTAGKRSSLLNLFFVCAAATLISVLLVINLGDGHSLWWFVYKLIPGASANRTIGTFYTVLIIPIGLCACHMLDAVFREIKLPSNISVLVLCAVVTFFGAEYTWKGGIYSATTSTGNIDYVNNMPPPPADCEVMYISNIQEPDPYWPFYQVKAWQIAVHYNIHTINGNSSQYPDGYDGIMFVGSENYEPAVLEWVKKHGLTGVYAFDDTQKVWIPVS